MKDMIAKRSLAALQAAVLSIVTAAGAAGQENRPWSIERLIGEGWQIAGYTGTFDIRSTLILFRHPENRFLIQCSTIYDVTRSPRTVVNCYELR